MKKSIKTIGIITIMGIMVICAYLLGTTQAKTVTAVKEIEKTVEVVPDGYININSKEFRENYVDMREVTYFETSNYGLQLYCADGSGYYWE
jgi:hypothetical protein